MSEVNKEVVQTPDADTENKASAQNPAAKGNAKKKEEPKLIPLDVLGKGVLKLATPITSEDKPVSELKYDFYALSGWEYAEAMDTDQNNRNAFAVSKKQALRLFAAAAAKVTAGMDATDIYHQIGLADAQRAAQVATVFLSRAGRELGTITYGA